MVIDPLIVVVAGVVVVALVTVIAPRFNVAGPLVLLAIGLGVSLLPFVPAIAVEPDVILVGVLPLCCTRPPSSCPRSSSAATSSRSPGCRSSSS